MRIGEILSLRWSQVNFERKVLVLEKTKSKKTRFVPMNQVLCEELSRLKNGNGASEYVFGYKSVRSGFENACKRAKIYDCTFHDLRRTFGTRLLECGIDIVTIQKLYGHSNPMVTQRYLHPDDKLTKEAVEFLVGPRHNPSAEQ